MNSHDVMLSWTAEGDKRLQDACASGSKLQLTHMALGNASTPLSITDLKQAQEVRNVIYQAPLECVTVDREKNSVIGELILPEDKKEEAIREIGVFELDTLVAVGYSSSPYQPVRQEGGALVQMVRLPLNTIPASAIETVSNVINFKESDTRYLHAAENLKDLVNLVTARNNLGLGTAAFKNTGTNASELITTGEADNRYLSATHDSQTSLQALLSEPKVLLYLLQPDLTPEKLTIWLGEAGNQAKFSRLLTAPAALMTLAASKTAMGAIAGSLAAMNTMKDSGTAMRTIMNSDTAINAIIDSVNASMVAGSATAMSTIAHSKIAMSTVAKNAAAIKTLAETKTALDATVRSEIAMDEIASSATALKDITQSQTAMKIIGASSMAMAKLVTGLAGLRTSNHADMQAVAGSDDTMSAIARSDTAMSAIAGSDTAMSVIARSDTAMSAVAKNAAAIKTLAETETALDATVRSEIAVTAVATSQTAMEAVAASQTAMTAVATSLTAREVLRNSPTAMAAIGANSMAIAKLATGLASGLNPQSYADMTAVAASQTAIEAVAASQTAMTAVATSLTAREVLRNSPTAMAAIGANSMAIAKLATGLASGLNPQSYADMTAVAASQTAIEAVAASQTAMEAVATSSPAKEVLRHSSIAMAAIGANSMAIAKLATGLASGLNPQSYADMTAVAASQTAIEAVAASQTAMEAVATSSPAKEVLRHSSIAMAAIGANSMAIAKLATGLASGLNPQSYADMTAVAASQTAMTAVATSLTAREVLRNSPTAMAAIGANSMAIAKLATGLASGLNPQSYADMTAVAASQIAMNAVVASAMALNAIVKSKLACKAIETSIQQYRTGVQNTLNVTSSSLFTKQSEKQVQANSIDDGSDTPNIYIPVKEFSNCSNHPGNEVVSLSNGLLILSSYHDYSGELNVNTGIALRGVKVILATPKGDDGSHHKSTYYVKFDVYTAV